MHARSRAARCTHVLTRLLVRIPVQEPTTSRDVSLSALRSRSAKELLEETRSGRLSSAGFKDALKQRSRERSQLSFRAGSSSYDSFRDNSIRESGPRLTYEDAGGDSGGGVTSRTGRASSDAYTPKDLPGRVRAGPSNLTPRTLASEADGRADEPDDESLLRPLSASDDAVQREFQLSPRRSARAQFSFEPTTQQYV